MSPPGSPGSRAGGGAESGPKENPVGAVELTEVGPAPDPGRPSSPRFSSGRIATLLHSGAAPDRSPTPPAAPPAPRAPNGGAGQGTQIGARAAAIASAPSRPTPAASAVESVENRAATGTAFYYADGGGPSAPPLPSAADAQEVAESLRARPSAATRAAVPLGLTRRCSACETRYPDDFLLCPRDATPLVQDASSREADPLLGKLLGETYQIVRVVGEGGMGRVYEARHLRLKERRFAVKTLHADLAKNGEIVARFMREAESASSLSHPNIVDVFDVHHLPDGTPYLVGEFLEGEELATYVESRGPLDPRAAAALGRQLCRALGAAHARGIIHRDVKPENIFLSASSLDALSAGDVPESTIKVLDFGISKVGGVENTHLTRTGLIMGTPSYMSPEQACGKPVDVRADVYSAGAVLYFALTGKRPFDAPDPTATLSMVLTEEPARPRSIQPRIPEALELVVQRAMAKEPRDRYPSMAELEQALVTFDAEGQKREQRAPASEPRVLAVRDGTARRAFELLRRSILASPPVSERASSSLVTASRPMIVITSGVLGLWLVGGATAALAGLVRVLHDGEITITECLLLVIGCLFAAATPIALFILHVKRKIWPNSVRSQQLAGDLKRTAATALITYGGLSIVARVAHTVFWRTSKELGNGYWDIALFLVSVAAAMTIGGARPLVRNMQRRRSA